MIDSRMLDLMDAGSGGLLQPALTGFVLGFIMIGPDHLGTLMSLSTLTSGLSAIKVGLLWGFGHSIGMVLLVPPFLLVRHLLSSQAAHMSVTWWEKMGDYFIGASMMTVALYFYIYESRHLELKSDGTYAAKACSCHSHDGIHTEVESQVHEASLPDLGEDYPDMPDLDTAGCPRRMKRICGRHFNPRRWGGKRKTERTPLVGQEDPAPFLCSLDSRDLRNALVGVLQGLCCPMALMGLGFMGKMTAHTLPALFTFLVVFMASSAFGSAIVTFGWGMLSSYGLATFISPLVVYRLANFLTFALGVVWIIANYYGFLDVLNFMEGAAANVMNKHPTDMSMSMPMLLVQGKQGMPMLK